jgi:hypothetical protein
MNWNSLLFWRQKSKSQARWTRENTKIPVRQIADDNHGQTKAEATSQPVGGAEMTLAVLLGPIFGKYFKRSHCDKATAPENRPYYLDAQRSCNVGKLLAHGFPQLRP